MSLQNKCDSQMDFATIFYGVIHYWSSFQLKFSFFVGGSATFFEQEKQKTKVLKTVTNLTKL